VEAKRKKVMLKSRQVVGEPVGSTARQWTEDLAGRGGIDRWSRWAISLTRQHRTVGRFGSSVAMIFASPAFVERIIREQWLRTANFYPSLRLSVRQILGQINRLSDNPTSLPQDSPLNFVRAPRLPEQITKSRNTEGLSSASLFLRTDHQATIQNDYRYLPLTRVFVRFNEADDLSQRRAASILAQQSLSTTYRRVKETHQRIEDLIFRVKAGVGVVFKETHRSEPSINQHQWNDDLRASSEKESLAPVIDVNTLTDQVIRQIDQRATAWRERMGRI